MAPLFEPILPFLRRRLSPAGFFGLYFTVGCFVMVVAGVIFGDLTEDVITNDPLTRVDQRVAEWFHRNSTPEFTDTMTAITFFGSPFCLFGLGLLTLLALWRKRLTYHMLMLIVTLPIGMGVCMLLKLAVHRQRPLWAAGQFNPLDYSFPSGHAMGSMLLYGSFSLLPYFSPGSKLARSLVILGLFFLAVLVGFSRIYLTVHYFSDVIGGLAAGILWVSFSATIITFLKRFRER